MRWIDATRQWARKIKKDALMLWFAYRDPRTPWLPKIICLIAVTYALSPIDLIPDFIPVLGYLDDVILLPAAIWLAVKLLPAQIVIDCRTQSQEWLNTHEHQPVNRWGVLFVLMVWGLVLFFSYLWFFQA